MKKIYLLILSFFILSSAFAQEPTIDLLPVGAKSPDAAILEKFGNVPVSYSTGVPDISIPIYEVKIGKINLPISLDYHAGGIRINDIPSSIGLGWALNCGGIVSRNMKGQPDEVGGYLSTPADTAIYNHPGTYYQFLYNGASDFEPDEFSYSTPGQSGKFLFNKDASVFQIPISDNNIQFINSTQNTQSSFKITDPNGVQYIYDLPETVSVAAAPAYNSSWRLTKIVDQNQKDTVFLTYDSGTGSEYTHDDVASFTNSPTGLSGFTSTNTLLATNATGISHPIEYFLNGVTWRGGKIAFTNGTGRLDRPNEVQLTEADLYTTTNGNLQKVKTVKLFQSYFYNNSTTLMTNPYSNNDARNYRLRLDSVGFYSSDGSILPSMYRLTYDNRLMASRESPAQDIWGFNNGQFGNQCLLAPQQALDYTQKSYSIGSANRNVDTGYVHACTLQSMQYPTGGKTVFQMESNQYQNPLNMVANGLACGVLSGSGPTTYTATFSCPVGYQNLNYVVNISSYNYSTQIPPPSITITDQTTGLQQVVTNPNYLQSYYSGVVYLTGYANSNLWFIGGHTYSITANISTNTSPNGPVLASISLNWQQNSSQQAVIGGGLRVKSVTNYDNNGKFINQDQYKYGTFAEEGYGQLLTSPTILSTNSTFSYNRIFVSILNGNMQAADAPISYVYHSNSLASISQIGGSPVVYTTVTKYQVSSSGGQINGRIIYEYGAPQDSIAGVTPHGPIILSEEWKANNLFYELTEKSINGGASFSPVLAKSYTYALDRSTPRTQLKIIKNFNVSGSQSESAASVTAEQSQYSSLPDFTLVLYPNPSGIMRLHQVATTTYTDNGQSLTTIENHYYDDNAHLFPTRIQTFSSKNDTLTKVMMYADAFSSSGNVYATMLNRNIKAPVVHVQLMKNSTQESLMKADYKDWFGNGAILVPMDVEEQVAANPIETRVNYNKYDQYGNIIQQQKVNAAYQSYIWDYNKVYPVAEVKNADSTSIAYTSFEADGTGNWTIGSTSRNVTGFTGAQSYSLSNGAMSKSGLTSTTTYVVSYWTTSSTPLSITGTVSGYPITGPTINGWTYYEHQITGQSAVTLNGTAVIDEVRLYPAGALMNTFTYNPLTGVSSACNEKNQVTYYEYDSFQRLMNVKDQYGNIIKNYQYHYQGQ